MADGVVRYQLVPEAVQPTMLGEADGRLTSRLRQIETAFRGAGFAAQISSNMDAWLKSHAVLISAAANALQMSGCDNRRLARSRDGLVLLVRAAREGFRMLRANGIAWERTGILATGKDVCDFCWRNRSAASSKTQAVLAEGD